MEIFFDSGILKSGFDLSKVKSNDFKNKINTNFITIIFEYSIFYLVFHTYININNMDFDAYIDLKIEKFRKKHLQPKPVNYEEKDNTK